MRCFQRSIGFLSSLYDVIICITIYFLTVFFQNLCMQFKPLHSDVIMNFSLTYRIHPLLHSYYSNPNRLTQLPTQMCSFPVKMMVHNSSWLAYWNFLTGCQFWFKDWVTSSNPHACSVFLSWNHAEVWPTLGVRCALLETQQQWWDYFLCISFFMWRRKMTMSLPLISLASLMTSPSEDQ